MAARTGLQWEKRGWPGGSIERVNGVAPFLPDLPVAPDEMEGPPRPGPLYSSVPWPSVSAFHLASMGIGAALFARERTGRGCCVTTSLLQGALVNGTFTWQRVEHPDRPGYRMWVTDPGCRTDSSAPVTAGGSTTGRPNRASCSNAIHEGRLAPDVSGRALKFDGSRVGMDPAELLVLRELAPAMQEAFGQFSSEEWVAAAAVAGVSVQPIRSSEEAFADPLFLEDGCVVEVKDPDVGLIRHVGLTIGMAATPGCVRGPAPRVGEHTDRVLADLPDPEPAATEIGPEAAGAQGLPALPLEGITVLDLGLAVAGPFGTQMLADFGADVIKVNQPSDQTWMNTYMGMSCNRGKRSVSLNLKTDRGMEAFRALVARADVVHTNMRYDAAEHLGVDYDSLRRINPRLVYCHTRGFENGPRMLLPGHDQSGSALTGVAWEEGGVGAGGKPIWPNISLGDLGNGMLSATAVLHALFHRERTGEGQFVTTSIVYAHLLDNSTRWVDAEGRSGTGQPHLDALGPRRLGTGAALPLRRGVDLHCRRRALAGVGRGIGSPGPDLRSPLRHGRRRRRSGCGAGCASRTAVRQPRRGGVGRDLDRSGRPSRGLVGDIQPRALRRCRAGGPGVDHHGRPGARGQVRGPGGSRLLLRLRHRRPAAPARRGEPHQGDTDVARLRRPRHRRVDPGRRGQRAVAVSERSTPLSTVMVSPVT